MSKSLIKPLGGYFELELPMDVHRLYPDALRVQSARAAFRALLNAGRPNRVWLPKYICDAMLSPLIAAGIEVVFYDLDRQFGVAKSVTLDPQDWLLYVNYFGVCAEQEEKLLKRFNPTQVVLDHSQAFFAPPKACLATIYSPRKFFGVPDGGLLTTSINVTEPEGIDGNSIARCTHLLKRIDSSLEAGYSDFKAAEESLWDTTPRKMSNLSKRLLAGIDHKTVRQRRNTNFQFLHQRLKHLNGLDIDLSHVDAPLCYPLLIDGQTLRERLFSERVFIATYWPEVRTRVATDSLEYRLVAECLPIPCDQRYSESDMKRIIDLITRFK